MNLIIDLGNTQAKTARFSNGHLVESLTFPKTSVVEMIEALDPYKGHPLILSSVIKIPRKLSLFLKDNFQFVRFTHQTRIPIENLYETPETLGLDRLAAVVGGHYLFPGKNILIIDAGTAITYEILTEDGKYRGGVISPGLDIRFKALHTFTDNLPLLSHEKKPGIIGTNTNDAIVSGVVNGFVCEVEAQISKLKLAYHIHQVIITGGNADYLHKQLKNSIFAIPNLVLIGLNEVLRYNIQK